MTRDRSALSDLHPIPTLERLCGAEVAGKFHDAFAGQEVRVPNYPSPCQAISLVIGWEAAKLLADECGGCTYAIPNNRARRAAVMFSEGKTVGEVALALSITTRAVYRMRERLGLGRHVQPVNATKLKGPPE